MVEKLEDLKDWKNYSIQSQENLKIAKSKGLDAVGLILTGKFNPNESIALLQTLADPKFSGELFEKEEAPYNFRINGEIASIEPLKNGKFSSHAIKSTNSTFPSIQMPLVTNYTQPATSASITFNAEQCSRFAKIVDIFEKSLNTKFKFEFVSNNGMYYKENTTGVFKKVITSYSIFEKNKVNSTYSLNENDKIVMIANITAIKLLEDYKNVHASAYEDMKVGFSDERIKIMEKIVSDIITLAIMRSIDLQNPELSYKVDEALKLQIANDLAILSSNGNEITKFIAPVSKDVIKNMAKTLNLNVERIAKNMEEMGFKYKKYPTNILDALFNASNLEKTHEIKLANRPKTKRAMHALVGPVLLAGITNLRQELPGIMDSFIITKKDKESLNGKSDSFVSPAQSILLMLGEKNKDLFPYVMLNYEGTKSRVINNVIDRFREQREEDFGKSYKKRLNDGLNEMYNAGGKPKKSGTIIKQTIKDSIKQAKAQRKNNKEDEK